MFTGAGLTAVAAVAAFFLLVERAPQAPEGSVPWVSPSRVRSAGDLPPFSVVSIGDDTRVRSGCGKLTRAQPPAYCETERIRWKA